MNSGKSGLDFFLRHQRKEAKDNHQPVEERYWIPSSISWSQIARSTSHRWFEGWKEDGRLERIKPGVLSIVQLNGMIGRWGRKSSGRIGNRSQWEWKRTSASLVSIHSDSNGRSGKSKTKANKSGHRRRIRFWWIRVVLTKKGDWPRGSQTKMERESTDMLLNGHSGGIKKFRRLFVG